MKQHTTAQQYKKTNGGFTLIETLVAIFILVLTVGALITLTAGGFYSVRYSRNQIVGNALMQEGLEYIRNTRDNVSLQGVSWSDWRNEFASNGCFSSDGCRVDPYALTTPLQACVGQCPIITYYQNQYFYGYQGVQYPMTLTEGYPTAFRRTVRMSDATAGAGQDHVLVEVTVEWLNGLNTKAVTQSMLLTNWTP
jgi:type II secretory pathway pseudopilin PulG